MRSKDPFEKIRARQPHAKLAFVFEVEDYSLVYYYDGYKLKTAKFKDNVLEQENSIEKAMANDGLFKEEDFTHSFIKNQETKMVCTPEAFLNNKMKRFSASDRLVWEVLYEVQPNSSATLAIGIDVVVARLDPPNPFTRIVPRSEWETADEIVRLLHDFPVLVEPVGGGDRRPNAHNIEQVLVYLPEIIKEAPKTEPVRNAISTCWETLRRHLEIAEYHPTLRPLLDKVGVLTKDYLLKG